jgi:hypothetical protein
VDLSHPSAHHQRHLYADHDAQKVKGAITMERTYKSLPWAVLLSGGLGYGLYLWLMSTENEKGFIDKFHISAYLLLVLTAVVVIGLLFFVRRLTQGGKYEFNFPASYWGAVGAWVAAMGIGAGSVLDLMQPADNFQMASCLAGILAALALLYVGFCRRTGARPNVLAHVAICGYFMLHLICMYRYWGARPQLYAYCFQLLAVVCAMLSVYHRARFDVEDGKRASYTYFNLLAVFFCVICLGKGPLYVGIGLWLLTDLCNLTPMPAPVQEAENEAE